MTLKMPSLDGTPSVIADHYAADGVIPIFRRPLRVRYSADTIDKTVPDHIAPTPYDGGSDVLDVTGSRPVLFMDGDGNFWSIEQSRLAFLQTLSATFYIMFRRTARGWKRWQPRLGVPAIPLPPPICFVYGATIQLIAGGTIGVTTYADGALGTNTTRGPYAMALNPLDGLLYFNDNSSHLRTLNLTTFEVGTSAMPNPFTFHSSSQSSICFDKNGLCYQWGSTGFVPRLVLYNVDGTLNATLANYFPGPITVWTDATHSFAIHSQDGSGFSGSGDMVLGLDGITVYICIPYSTNNNTGVSISGTGIEIQSVVVRWDTVASKLMVVAGIVQNVASTPSNFPSPTTAPDNPSGTNETDQGEGNAGIGSLLGNVVGIAMDADGKLYTVASDVNMVRLIDTTASGNPVTSLSDHDAVTFDASHATHTSTSNGWAGWPSDANVFGGDEFAAFNGTTGYPGGQMSFAQGICLTDCGGQLIVDAGNQAIRHIDIDDVLHTIAGDPDHRLSPPIYLYPNIVRASARFKRINPQKIVAIGGNRYIISQAGDGSTIPDALYMLVSLNKCLSATPTMRLVAGGQPSDEDGHQIDGALGTNSLERVQQMCWGPDGKIWCAGFGRDVDTDTANIRTYDPITGEVATLPFHSSFGDRGRIIGICCSAANNVYFIVNSTDDEDTCYICEVPAGATSQSDVVDITFLSAFGGNAGNFKYLGVVTNSDGKEFLILDNFNFAAIYYYDVTAGGATVRIEGSEDKVNPISEDPDSQDMGEGVGGMEGTLGEQTVSMVVTASGEIVTGSFQNQVIRSGQVSFVDDGEGGTVPSVVNLHSITDHSLDDGRGYGGDEAIAFTLGNYGPQFNGLYGVGTDDCGNYYCLDLENLVLRMVTSDGILHTIAGNGVSGFDEDAVFAGPDPVVATSVALGNDIQDGGCVLPDPAGGLYVACGDRLYKLEG